MSNIQSFANFTSGMKGVDSGIRRIGPDTSPGRPGRPGRPKPGFTPPKPKPKRVKPTTFEGSGKLNEFLDVPNEDMNGARLNIKDLSKYLNIEETDLCDIIYNGIVSNEYSDITEQQINTLAYSYGLI